MANGTCVKVVVSVGAAVSLCSCVLYPTTRTFYEPNGDDGTIVHGGCEYLTTHNTIERRIGGAYVTMSVGDDNEPAKRPDFLDVHVTVSVKGGGAIIDPAQILVVSEADGSEVSGVVIPSAAAQLGLRVQVKSDTTGVTIRYPAPAGHLDTLSVKLKRGALRLNDQALDGWSVRFRHVKKHDTFYGSMNC
jgi:hypothetical protein